MIPERKTSADGALKQPGAEAASAPACLVRPAAVPEKEKTSVSLRAALALRGCCLRLQPLRTKACWLRRSPKASNQPPEPTRGTDSFPLFQSRWPRVAQL
jgi:hypothetical protein